MNKSFVWDDAKNARLIRDRGISFDDIVVHIQNGDLVDVVANANQDKYSGQRVFVVNVDGYIHLVPFDETGDHYFLRTIFPSRKATKKYLRGADHETR